MWEKFWLMYLSDFWHVTPGGKIGEMGQTHETKQFWGVALLKAHRQLHMVEIYSGSKKLQTCPRGQEPRRRRDRDNVFGAWACCHKTCSEPCRNIPPNFYWFRGVNIIELPCSEKIQLPSPDTICYRFRALHFAAPCAIWLKTKVLEIFDMQS